MYGSDGQRPRMKIIFVALRAVGRYEPEAECDLLRQRVTGDGASRTGVDGIERVGAARGTLG